MTASFEGRHATGAQQEQVDIIVTFVEEELFASEDSGADQLIVPVGTQLIGTWTDKQPRDGEACTVLINGEEWSILCDDATVVCPIDRLAPWGEQRRIAAGHLEQARAAFKRQDRKEARRLYACCLIEFEASNAPLVELAGIYVEYAATLMEVEARREAIDALEKAASAWGSAGENPLNRMVGAHVEYAEQAAQTLTTLLRLYLHDNDQARMRRTIERLLMVNKLIKKRYTTKVDLLLWVAEAFSALEESELALVYFEQAKRFYGQQLARYTGVPYLEAKTSPSISIAWKLR